MEKWPNLFIVGAHKAGTTSLYEYLKNIPEIYMSPIKEPHYFSHNTVPEKHHHLKPIRDKKKYLELFEKVSDEKIIGEASPSYLADPNVPLLIHQVSPQARIIISLRDPLERTYSDYLMCASTGALKLSFHEEMQKELKYGRDKSKPSLELEEGFYYKNVKKYFDTFGPAHVKVIIFEEFIKNITSTVKDILGFLGLDEINYQFDSKAYNEFPGLPGRMGKEIITSDTVNKISKSILSASTRKYLREKFFLRKGTKPLMKQQDREFLTNFYRDDVKKLQTMLGRKLPWPNF